jgi:hypothetical protein
MPDFWMTMAKTAVAAALLFLPLSPALADQGGPVPAPKDNAVLQLAFPAWLGSIHLGGKFEADFEWKDKRDGADRESGAASDLFIGKAELGAEVDVVEWMKGKVVFLAEDLGTEDETDVGLDEATLAFGKEGVPFSLVVGKRVQPFGVFENRLVADPMTQDAYETNRTGVTAGISGPMDLALTATVYKGEEMMKRLFESGLFDAEAVTRAEHEEAEEVSSCILSATVKPLGGPVTFFGSFLSERGAGDRNDTVSAGIHFEPETFKGFRANGEYMKALSRERYEGFDREFREGVLSVTVAYELPAQPLEIAARYEHFDDDGLADASRTSSVKQRYGAGARYSFYRNPDGVPDIFLAGEYRHTEYRVHSSQKTVRADSNEEFFARLGIAF